MLQGCWFLLKPLGETSSDCSTRRSAAASSQRWRVFSAAASFSARSEARCRCQQHSPSFLQRSLALFPPLLVLSLKFKASETRAGHVVPPRAQHLALPGARRAVQEGTGDRGRGCPSSGAAGGSVPLPSAAAALEELLGAVPSRTRCRLRARELP